MKTETNKSIPGPCGKMCVKREKKKKKKKKFFLDEAKPPKHIFSSFHSAPQYRLKCLVTFTQPKGILTRWHSPTLFRFEHKSRSATCMEGTCKPVNVDVPLKMWASNGILERAQRQGSGCYWFLDMPMPQMQPVVER